MKPLTSILAATDLSAPARHAVDRGFRIAAESGARYTVLHALELNALDSLAALFAKDAPDIKRRLEDEAREALQRLLADPVRNRNVAAEARIVVGSPLEAIAAETDALDAALLLLGARGESFLRHVLLGSMASRLLSMSLKTPVLVVKQAPHEPYRRLLVAVDFSPVSRHAIRLGRRLAPTADIVLLHAFELPYEGKLAYAGVEESVVRHYIGRAREDRREQLHALAEAAGLPPAGYSVRLIHGDPSQQIIAQEQEQDSDLIIVGKHGTHLTRELLLGSVTKHVLAESQCDVLVIPDGRMPEEASATPEGQP